MPSRTPHKLRLIFSTVASEEQAASIARALVDERLAACVNIVGPVRSIYRWRDAIEDEREFLLLIKTRATLYIKVEKRIRELHSYEVAEVISTSIDRGSPPYVKWMLETTGPRRTSEPSRRAKRNTKGASGN
ncbi:MAG TPA: divalent-cation tolerance protein CutA [Candidatus Binataceae bacterium]|jgi:periplasmic divalent cation tolerance protein